LKLSIENCGQTAADGVIRKLPALYPMVPSPTLCDLPLRHNTARLTYYSSLLPFKVIQGQ